MAITNLGTRDVSLPYQWVGFDPILLRNSKFYALYFEIASPSFAEVYSTFSYRINGTIDNGLASTSEPMGLIEAVPELQVTQLKILQYWDRNEDLTIEVRRNFFFSSQSNLASTQVTLQIDPNENYGL